MARGPVSVLGVDLLHLPYSVWKLPACVATEPGSWDFLIIFHCQSQFTFGVTLVSGVLRNGQT